MDFSTLIFVTFGLTYIGIIIYMANQIEAARAESDPIASDPLMPQAMIIRWMLYGLVAVMFSVGLMVLQVALIGDIPAAGDPPPIQVDLPSAVVTFGLSVIASIIAFRLIASEDMRQGLQRLITTYDAGSSVHTVAAVMMLVIVVWSIADFVFRGGVSGFAADVQNSGIEIDMIVFQAVIQVLIALLGVGLALRRDLAPALERLGLRMPTTQDVTWGIGAGVFFMVLMFVFNSIWALITTPELFEEQTSAAQELSQSFATFPLALILAAAAAVGEEIWVRGALQPIFGIVPTSLFFVLLHTQVLLTPGMFVIFAVSLGLGWLRQRQSTTAAIIGHFVFNFIPLALLSMEAV